MLENVERNTDFLFDFLILNVEFFAVAILYIDRIKDNNTKVVSKALSVTCLNPVTFCDICAETLLATYTKSVMWVSQKMR